MGAMGWKTQDAYDDAAAAEERAWVASLPAGARRRFRLRQALGVLGLITFAGLCAALLLR